jgi:hypothetical protein
MRGALKLLSVALVLVMIFGIIVIMINDARNKAHRLQCASNLHVIAMALPQFEGVHGYFPPGTVINEALPVDKRLSWLTQIWPSFLNGGTSSAFNYKESWDSDANVPVRWVVRGGKSELMGDVKLLICPSDRNHTESPLPSSTNYVGIAGLGQAAAELPLKDSRAGFFGYDRVLRTQDLKKGLSGTLAIGEVVECGPWTAGGWPTVRGIVPRDQVYLGEREQFTSFHRDGSLIARTNPVVVYFAFADGSVRALTKSISPPVFEGLATIGGQKTVGNLEP